MVLSTVEFRRFDTFSGYFNLKFVFTFTKNISMCNFMGFKVSRLEYVRLKNIEKKEGTLAALRTLEVYKDGFKYSNSAIVRKAGENDIEIVEAHWEFIPPWIKNMADLKAARSQGIPWLNATSEKLLESKMFRSAALKRRCLVIASHFFEWMHYKAEGEKKSNAYPHVIGLNEHEYFYMAGIWQPWVDKETGETMDTFAIVTTKANKLMEQIHNTKMRMPTILTEELAWEWIMEDLPEKRIQQIAYFQIPSEMMYAHPIRKDFKIADNPCEEFEYPELPPLDIAL